MLPPQGAGSLGTLAGAALGVLSTAAPSMAPAAKEGGLAGQSGVL